ncbi:MAG: cation-transporting P-type ATPase [Patescibacteria group bacterium]|nr:cation-transporting P-type ATPase [Patescibacteria group bacterium]MCL5261852.1 cation-transporting P-type ATPase [Patescibacteria group bacterium]
MKNINQETFGLTSFEADRLLRRIGPNQIFKPEKISFWVIGRHEITEPMILLLFVVGVVYSLWGRLEDAVTIFVVISLLVFAEVWNEFRAKKAISALADLAAPKAKAVRDGNFVEIDPRTIVPGDILTLAVGTRVAADGVVEEGLGLQADESSLTGESLSEEKTKGSAVYAGTIIVSGEGRLKVTTTGAKTKFGQIAAALKTIAPPKTGLQLEMKSLSGRFVYVALFFSIIIPLIGVLRGGDARLMVLTGLSLAFATIPEELPIIITMVLGLGSYSLSKNNFLVKKLKSAEVLGNATVIVTDKTGTLTEAAMKVAGVYPASREKEIIKVALAAISAYSQSSLEAGILSFAEGRNIARDSREIVSEENVSDRRKTKAVVRKYNGQAELYLSGAPEEVFGVSAEVPEEMTERLKEETTKGRRVIAVALKNLAVGDEKRPIIDLERGLRLAGIISFEDPPREGVGRTIALATHAGIRTIMVTGDHRETARYIAQEVGILKTNRVLTGKDIDALDDDKLCEAVKTCSVFARATPQHKYRLVKALQKNGEVVAVTGDGVNDVLALKAADIGIAMGIKGTDVAKEAAEIVIADDNYVTLARGIFEGRKFYDNLSKGVKYYLAVKAALIMIFLLPILIGLPLPFSPIQIIVLELFMDLAASAGFVAEPAEKDIYNRPPRNPRGKILNRKSVAGIFVSGLILFFVVTAVYLITRRAYGDSTAMTLAFSAWIFGHIFLAFISRSDKEPIWRLGFLNNKTIDLWAFGAIGLLLLGLYVPKIGHNLNLTPITCSLLIEVAIFAAGMMLFLDASQYWFSSRRK